MDKKPSVFYGYPSKPELLAETVREAAAEIERTNIVASTTWENLRVGGRLVIDTVLRAIDESTMACFDVTYPNENVLFELGYSIGKDKIIWPIIDETIDASARTYQRLSPLTTVGYTRYSNSAGIRAEFLRQQPHIGAQSIFSESIEPMLTPSRVSSVFYLRSPHQTQADTRLTSSMYAFQRDGRRCIIADPDESALQPLAWYAQQIYVSSCVVVHMAAPARSGADLYNGRASFIAGLAHGMNRPMLMLAEESYSVPLDYRDLLYRYKTARSCADKAETWVAQNLSNEPEPAKSAAGLGARRLSVELQSLRLGEHVAENEAEALEGYFLETGEFSDVLNRDFAIYVGRKGTGKTANMLMAAERLRDDARNLVCVIKPHGYDLQGAMDLLAQFSRREGKDFVVDGLWRYLIMGEIARSLAEEIRGRRLRPDPGSPELHLLSYVDDPRHDLDFEFSVRLERAIARLEDGLTDKDQYADREQRVSEALFGDLIGGMHEAIVAALHEKTRVCVLVDNIDKGWNKEADISILAPLVLGLLTATGHVARGLRRGGKSAGQGPRVSLAAFLRSDIYYYVSRAAREPDKLPVLRMSWSDPQLLLRIIEARYEAGVEGEVDGSEIWEKFFCETMRGAKTPDFIAGRVLPRPRDIIQFCNSAIISAVNAGRSRIEADDLLSAEAAYSQFAVEAIRVENGLSQEELETVLFEFAGANSVLAESAALDLVSSAGVSSHSAKELLDYLVRLSFLGRESRNGGFVYAENPEDFRRLEGLAAKQRTSERDVLVEIHPAFRRYLEIQEAGAM